MSLRLHLYRPSEEAEADPVQAVAFRPDVLFPTAADFVYTA